MSKKIVTPEWIKAGAKVLIAKFDPFRYNPPSDVLDSAKEVVIEKVGIKFFYIGGTAYDKVSLKASDGGFTKRRVFRDRDDIFEFLDTRTKVSQILGGTDTLTPAQVKLAHAIMFPHKSTFWGTEEIQNSIDTTEWYGIATAMYHGSKFGKINAPQVRRAMEEIKEVTAQFLSIVAQGILAKHIPSQASLPPTKIRKPKPCKYCGGNCPYDPDNSCDGYQGDIDGLYKAQ